MSRPTYALAVSFLYTLVSVALGATTLHCSGSALPADSAPTDSGSALPNTDASTTQPMPGPDDAAQPDAGSSPGLPLDDAGTTLNADADVDASTSALDAGQTPPTDAGDATTPPTPGKVHVSGTTLLRDGAPWTPHGLNMIAFVAPPAAQSGVFLQAYQHYSPAELSSLRTWGADTVRFQVSQPGLDPQNALYTQTFLDQVHAAVLDARAAGLNVLVSIQDEAQSGEQTPMQLPNAATLRVWSELAPLFNDDTGILYELMNEPEPGPSAANWTDWQNAMNAVIAEVRATGSTNVVVADGLSYATSLNGAPSLTDSAHEVVYAVHPYFHSADAETSSAWDTKWGTFAATSPVLVTEWTTVANAAQSGSTYFCDSTTAGAALALLDYLAAKKIGMIAFAYDFSGNVFGSAAYGFPAKSSSFAGDAGCGSAGYGPGTVLQDWFRTGAVPTTLE